MNSTALIASKNFLVFVKLQICSFHAKKSSQSITLKENYIKLDYVLNSEKVGDWLDSILHDGLGWFCSLVLAHLSQANESGE